MILKVILILFLLKSSQCSLVLDSMTQNSLYVSSYCPTMKNCIEGSHVICQYYDHRQTVGHLCRNYVKITITPQMVQQILEGVNNIRMKLATGDETGKGGHPLPRAYGMMRMHWDSELATLAQVLADQCLGLKEDDCRATDKFSNPSQLITLINFKTPSWEYLTQNSTERGLSDDKIRTSIDKALKSLHAVKRLISASDINSCPVLETIPDKASRSYLKLIPGKATHIGCGISAYTRSQISSSGSQHTYNSIQLVCNVSDEPQQSKPVYTTNPPIPDTGFIEKCGCPDGYRESRGCLCEKDTHSTKENTEIRHLNVDKQVMRAHSQSHETAEPCANSNGICDNKPQVMMLPIFEIHDAPDDLNEPENDIEKQFHSRFGNASFIPASIENNEILNDKAYSEIEHGLLKMHDDDVTNQEYRKAMPSEEDQFKGHGNVAISNEGSAEHFEHAYPSMEDNIVEHDPRLNSDDDDTNAVNGVYRDFTGEEDISFLDILDHLERAVNNIELKGEEKEIFEYKMRKIYEAALKSQTHHESDELEGEFKDLTEYLKHKSDGEVVDESVHNDKENQMYGYNINRRDSDVKNLNNGIDEKLIQILKKKHLPTNDYFSKPVRMEGHNHGNDALSNYLVPRKQEKINDYKDNFAQLNKRDSSMDKRNLKKIRTPVTKSHHGRRQKIFKKKLYNKRQKQKSLQQANNTFGRRSFLYPKHNARKIPKSFRYRRILEVSTK